MVTAYKDGETTARHDKMDVEAFFGRVYEAVKRHQGGNIVDLFSGGGRDISAFYRKLVGQGNFAAIDTDPQRIVDILKKNDLGNDGRIFQLVANQEGLTDCFKRHNVAVIQGTFPDAPFGDPKVSGIDLKADFALCNAGIMFLKPLDLVLTIKTIANMLNTGGELALRFSLAREDKKEATGKTYFIHEPETVIAMLEQNGLDVKRHPDLPDPERDFSWVDIQAVKPKF